MIRKHFEQPGSVCVLGAEGTCLPSLVSACAIPECTDMQSLVTYGFSHLRALREFSDPPTSYLRASHTEKFITFLRKV